ncbi:ACT domain-containing protein [Verrucomicrobiota bacterium]
MIKKQFTIYLENKPGVLARIMKALADKKVNIEGISVSESTDVGLVQIVANNAAATKKALSDIGVPFTEQEIALLPISNKPGELYRLTSGLAKSGVNINYVYATSCQGEGSCRCYAVVSAPNLKRVVAAWKKIS